MVLIDNLSDSADQITAIQLTDGSVGTLELIFQGSTSRWIFNCTHASFPNGALNGQMLCVHPNILRNFKNLIPFGIACISNNGNDPVNLEDFANGNVSLFILDATDVKAVELSFFGTAT